jgi:hypothetical protein
MSCHRRVYIYANISYYEIFIFTSYKFVLFSRSIDLRYIAGKAWAQHLGTQEADNLIKTIKYIM